MSIRFLKPLCLLCAFGTMMLTTTLSAQRTDSQSKIQPQERQPSALNDHSKKCLAELEKAVDLNAEQKQKIQDVYLRSEAAQTATWQKFNQAQMSAIHLEAEMCSAMEARMTDSQKQKFTAARTSQQEKTVAGTYTSDIPLKARETSDRTEGNQANKGDKADPTLQSSDKPAKTPNEKSLTPSESFVQTAIIAPIEQVVSSLGMNSEDSAKCKTACSAYHIRLNTVWNEIHTLHNELVTQEAKTIQAIANVLTKEQISKLEQHRTLALKTETSGSTTNR